MLSEAGNGRKSTKTKNKKRITLSRAVAELRCCLHLVNVNPTDDGEKKERRKEKKRRGKSPFYGRVRWTGEARTVWG